MLKQRLIASITVRRGIAVQSIGFRRFLPIGRPEIVAENLNRWGVDEIVLLDISAPREGRGPDRALIEAVAAKAYVPVTVGGGIRTVVDVRNVVQWGADKVAINTAAIADPRLVDRAAERFGRQCVVCSIDAVADTDGAHQVVTEAGSRATGRDPVEIARIMEEHGAGEILLNAVHRDGAKCGYDRRLIERVTAAVTIPVIVLGGVGHPRHFLEGARIAGVSAVAAGNFFYFTEHSVLTAKAYLADAGIGLRHDSYADYRGRAFDEQGRIAKRDDRELENLVFTHYPDEVI